MDIPKLTWCEMLDKYLDGAVEKRDMFLDGEEVLFDLSLVLQSGSDGEDNIRIIVDYCKAAFPYLVSQARGDLMGSDFANSEGNVIDREYTLDELWCRSISTAKLIYGLENLCVANKIYPPFCFSELFKTLQKSGVFPKLGSSLNLDSINSILCANWAGKESEYCLKQATKQCTECKLVAYCSSECQRDHWQRHRLLCKRLTSAEAGPSNMDEDMDEKDSRTPGYTMLWDRVPAFGLLGTWQSPRGREADQLPNPLRLCFDGCFDLNNVVETLHQMSSEDYNGDATLFINCTNRVALARNLILCFMLVMAAASGEGSAVDAIIAIWYSAYLTPFQFLFLQESIILMLQQVMGVIPKSEETASDLIFTDCSEDMEHIHERLDDLQMFSLGDAVGCVFSGVSWIRTRFQGFDICKYLYTMALLPLSSAEIDGSRQSCIRKFDTSASLNDFLVAPHAAALEQFRHSGLLLPYSQFSGHHTLPNPTLFQAIPWPEQAGGWVAECNAVDPFSGWPINKVLKSTRGAPHNVPTNDIFGSLYFFIRDRILSAMDACRKSRVTIEFSDKCTELFVRDLRYKRPGLMSIYRAMATSMPPLCNSPTQWNLRAFLNGWAPVIAKQGGETLVVRWEPDSEYDATQALSKFDSFIARFSDERLARSLRRYRAAIAGARVDIDRLSPLFLNDLTFLTKHYRELEAGFRSGRPPLPAPYMSRRDVHLAWPQKPCTVTVGLIPATGGKLKPGQQAPGDDTDMGTLIACPETCYATVMLTMLNHFTMFTEWSLNWFGRSLID